MADPPANTQGTREPLITRVEDAEQPCGGLSDSDCESDDDGDEEVRATLRTSAAVVVAPTLARSWGVGETTGAQL